MAGKNRESDVCLGLFKGRIYHGRISDKLTKKLNKNTLDKFLNALRKGFVTRDQGDQGVKFINDAVVEIKVTGDKRLYTVKRHELLLIFDHCGNHKAVKRFAKLHNTVDSCN